MANEGSESRPGHPQADDPGSVGSAGNRALAPSRGDGRVSPPAEDGAAAVKPPGYFEGESMTRRRMFTGGAMALGGIAGAAIGLPAIGFALGPVFEEEEVSFQDVGAVAEFTTDNYVPKTITLKSGIGEAGRSTVYIRKSSPALPGEKEGEFVAISTRCVHAGCPVRWVTAAERFVCPCHGGVYDFQGKVEGGPPVRPLDRFVTRVQNGTVQIGPRFSVNSELKRFSPRDPGEPLDGLWKFLYPKRPTTPSPP
jgi:menaquinol-cytochrome c reductase iron-sulfur subunit